MSALRQIARALGGEVSGRQVLCPGPGHSPGDRSLAVRPSPDAPNGFVVHSFCGDDWRACRDHVSSRLGSAPRWTPSSPGRSPVRPNAEAADDDERIALALENWNGSTPLRDTVGWHYLIERRGLHIGALEFDHALRWHEGIGAIVALMTDPITNKPTGVHRTYLDPHGSKRERKMLGRQGVVRLSPDEDVLEGLGIAEGIETALGVLTTGWAPVWAATSAGGIERFPVLSGIKALTIFADPDSAGIASAASCARRWTAARREVCITNPKDACDEV